MTDVFKSLDAASSTGPGAALDTRKITKLAVYQLDFAGTATSLSLKIEVSLNGESWHSLGGLSGLPGDFPTTYMTSIAGGLPFRFVRANLVALPGGGSPSVTVLIAEAD